MKKFSSYHFLWFFMVLFLFTACGKENVAPITIPETMIEDASESHCEELLTPAETVVPTTTPVVTPVATPTAEPIVTPEETYAFWDQIHDYSLDQQALTANDELKNLSVQFGNTPEELHITWFSKSGSKGHVNFTEVTGETLTSSVTTQGSFSVPGYHRNRAVVTGLKPNATYQYQVGNGTAISPIYTYHTGELYPSEFSFTITSDPEIGLGDLDDNVYEIHSTAWKRSLNRMKEQIPDSRFVLSLGDHVARKDAPEEYDLFLDQSVLYSTPLMPVVGNHDTGSGFFGEHFYLPNLSRHGHSNGDDGDYWFIYGDVLFMILNNSSDCDDIDHELFIMETLDAAPATKWRVLASHYSPVSNVERYQGSAESVDDYFDYAEKYDIDLFFGGHDHVYTRSFLMTDDDKFLSTAEENEFTNPEGAIYLIFSTATNSLFRDPDNYPWAAFSIQTGHPQISRAHVTENSFTVTTYEADTWKQLDTVTIYKD